MGAAVKTPTLLVERVSCTSCTRPIGEDRAVFGPGGLCPIVCEVATLGHAPEVDSEGHCSRQKTSEARAAQPAMI